MVKQSPQQLLGFLGFFEFGEYRCIFIASFVSISCLALCLLFDQNAVHQIVQDQDQAFEEGSPEPAIALLDPPAHGQHHPVCFTISFLSIVELSILVSFAEMDCFVRPCCICIG